MRKLCGLTVMVILGAGSLSVAELATTTGAKKISTKSSVMVGDQTLNLNLAVKIGDVKSDATQATAGRDRPGKLKQASAETEKALAHRQRPGL